MKNLHFVLNKGKWFVSFYLIGFDINKVKLGSDRIDVLLGFGIGWTIPANRFVNHKTFFLHLDWPKFNIAEGQYKSPIYYHGR